VKTASGAAAADQKANRRVALHGRKKAVIADIDIHVGRGDHLDREAEVETAAGGGFAFMDQFVTGRAQLVAQRREKLQCRDRGALDPPALAQLLSFEAFAAHPPVDEAVKRQVITVERHAAIRDQPRAGWQHEIERRHRRGPKHQGQKTSGAAGHLACA
jgi:hypothetical protein